MYLEKISSNCAPAISPLQPLCSRRLVGCCDIRLTFARTLPTQRMQTKDACLMVAAAGEAIWARCANALGHPEWLSRRLTHFSAPHAGSDPLSQHEPFAG